ncbi:quinone-dependent dihydroorotate dehydrogenase [Companilactobacillus furfuricola]|uniref:quinone-dependent dihydroorotate dehydrogenase n=1 Tax=Companilactobacillus furfuricola TaxID=1462575 RepID=UPI000F7B8057|nr:quinone-dependent dihydroorotate dehydrogenase [Companilactobacillus furfuricola]
MDWYHLARPAIFAIDPEVDHHIVANGLKLFNKTPQVLQKLFYAKKRQNLQTTIKGITFDSPIGIAAGFDKNAEFYNSLGGLGAGFVEVGSITKSPQAGNPKKRVFRLPEDQAIINRMGLNNIGLKKAISNLQGQHHTKVGLSLAPSHGLDTQQMIDELVEDVKLSHDSADYIALNLSCPNQAGVVSLQKTEVLLELLTKIKDLMIDEPVFCKFSSDLTVDQVLDILAETESLMDGVILSNTSLRRKGLTSANKDEKGGLSGKPLFASSLKLTKAVFAKYGTDLPIIFSGGIFDYHDAEQALDAGASLVQVYTGFIYNGPSQIENINRHLSETRVISDFKNE